MPFGPAPGQTRLLTLELEPEVEAKLDAIREDEYVVVLRLAEMLALMGRRLTEPQAKPLGEGVYELRPGAWRLTYWFPSEDRIVFLTMFRKQRDRDTRQVTYAKSTRKRCEREHFAADPHGSWFDRPREEK